jgi:hypothetical protein
VVDRVRVAVAVYLALPHQGSWKARIGLQGRQNYLEDRLPLLKNGTVLLTCFSSCEHDGHPCGDQHYH